MTQDELITMISERASVSRQTVHQILEAIGGIWAEEVLGSGELMLDDIGMFLIDHFPGRKGLDSERRQIFAVPPRDQVVFIPSHILIEWSNKVQ